MTIRVAIADDQKLLTEAFRSLLRPAPDVTVVGSALDGLGIVELCRSCPVDVVLMDIRMPTIDGIEATRLIRALPTPPAVIILTTFSLDKYVTSALQAGAAGFLVKDAEAEELLDAIRRVHAGGAVLAPEAAVHAIANIQQRRPVPPEVDSRHPAFATLLDHVTPREREVLALIGAGQTNREIAARLHVAETTVKTHVGNLLAKLQRRDRVALVVFAHQTGIVTDATAGDGPPGLL